MSTIDLGGNTVIVQDIQVGATGPGQTGTSLSSTELSYVDGVTAGTVTASKAVVVDASKNIATFGTVGSAAHTITSAGASALAVGRQGATDPSLKVDASATTAATGVEIVSAAAAGGVNVRAISSGTNENLTINAKGSGTIGIGSVSTGAVTITPATTITGVLTATGGTTSVAGSQLYSGTAIPAGGTAGTGLKMSSTSNLGIFFGSGAPSLAAAQGSLYLRTDGSSTSTRLYVNTTGSTTWTNVTTAA